MATFQGPAKQGTSESTFRSTGQTRTNDSRQLIRDISRVSREENPIERDIRNKRAGMTRIAGGGGGRNSRGRRLRDDEIIPETTGAVEQVMAPTENISSEIPINPRTNNPYNIVSLPKNQRDIYKDYKDRYGSVTGTLKYIGERTQGKFDTLERKYAPQGQSLASTGAVSETIQTAPYFVPVIGNVVGVKSGFESLEKNPQSSTVGATTQIVLSAAGFGLEAQGVTKAGAKILGKVKEGGENLYFKSETYRGPKTTEFGYLGRGDQFIKSPASDLRSLPSTDGGIIGVAPIRLKASDRIIGGGKEGFIGKSPLQLSDEGFKSSFSQIKNTIETEGNAFIGARMLSSNIKSSAAEPFQRVYSKASEMALPFLRKATQRTIANREFNAIQIQRARNIANQPNSQFFSDLIYNANVGVRQGLEAARSQANILGSRLLTTANRTNKNISALSNRLYTKTSEFTSPFLRRTTARRLDNQFFNAIQIQRARNIAGPSSPSIIGGFFSRTGRSARRAVSSINSKLLANAALERRRDSFLLSPESNLPIVGEVKINKVAPKPDKPIIKSTFIRPEAPPSIVSSSPGTVQILQSPRSEFEARGLYERTDMISPRARAKVTSPTGLVGLNTSPATSSKVQPGLIDNSSSNFDNLSIFKTKPKIIAGTIGGSKRRQDTSQITSLASPVFESTKEDTKISSRFFSRFNEKQKENLIIRERQRQRERGGQRDKIKPRSRSFSSESEETRKSLFGKLTKASVEGFDVFTRKGGKEVKVFENLPMNLATKKGSDLAMGTLRASFNVKPSGKRTSIQDIDFNLNSDFFRPGKRVAGFVERSKYRLDRPAERREISFFKRSKKKVKYL